MARLLSPSAFGLVAMGGVILRFGSYFAQMGMGQAVIQRKELRKEHIRAAFTSSVVLSALFLGLVWLLAPFALLIFRNPQVVPIVRVMAISFVMTGLSTTSLALLRRELKFKALALIQIVSYIIGYAGVGIISALSGFGVWSLVLASLSSGFLSGLLSYLVVRHDLRFIFSWEHYKPLFTFGGRISGISFLEFIGGTLDTLFVGRFLGATELGIYNRASSVINLPMQYFTTSVSSVLFPSFSRIQTEKVKLKRVYLNTISTVGLFLFAASLGVSVCSKQVVLVLLGPKWVAAIPVLQILALSTPFSLISHFGGVTCDATGYLTPKVFIQFFYILLLGSLFYVLGVHGLIGYAVALLIAQVVRTLVYIVLIAKLLGINPREIVNSYVPPFASGLMIAIAILLTRVLLNPFTRSNTVLLGAVMLVGALGLFVSFFLKINSDSREFLEERLLGGSQLYLKLRRVLAWEIK